jgi:hypothetical protein
MAIEEVPRVIPERREGQQVAQADPATSREEQLLRMFRERYGEVPGSPQWQERQRQRLEQERGGVEDRRDNERWQRDQLERGFDRDRLERQRRERDRLDRR